MTPSKGSVSRGAACWARLSILNALLPVLLLAPASGHAGDYSYIQCWGGPADDGSGGQFRLTDTTIEKWDASHANWNDLCGDSSALKAGEEWRLSKCEVNTNAVTVAFEDSDPRFVGWAIISISRITGAFSRSYRIGAVDHELRGRDYDGSCQPTTDPALDRPKF